MLQCVRTITHAQFWTTVLGQYFPRRDNHHGRERRGGGRVHRCSEPDLLDRWEEERRREYTNLQFWHATGQFDHQPERKLHAYNQNHCGDCKCPTLPPPAPASGPKGLYVAGGTFLATALILCINPRRFRCWALSGLLFFSLTIGWVAGCGGGSNSVGPVGTTADTYTVTFHAADAATGTVTAQDYFNFTVN